MAELIKLPQQVFRHAELVTSQKYREKTKQDKKITLKKRNYPHNSFVDFLKRQKFIWGLKL